MIDGAGLKAEVVRRVHRTLSDLHATTDLRSALDGFCESLYDLLQCRAVVIHLAEQDDMVGVAYGGDPSVQALVGRRQPVQMWHSLLEASTPQGTLRFCRDIPVHLDALSPQTLPSEDADEQFGDEEHWGARNLLLAPLTAGGE
ncbi:MAG: hypothetical protein H0U61_11985, partial [Nocardioidaceae bacterium]|nr:hypothetical protein [Nocardioidaceae bacterium]